MDFPVVLMLTLRLVTMGTACLTSPMKACTRLIKTPRVIENELPSILSIQVADHLVDSSKGIQTLVFGISGHTVVRVVGIYSTSHRMKNLGHDDPLYRPGSVTQMLEKIKFSLGLFKYFSLMENISGTGCTKFQYILNLNWCTHNFPLKYCNISLFIYKNTFATIFFNCQIITVTALRLKFDNYCATT